MNVDQREQHGEDGWGYRDGDISEEELLRTSVGRGFYLIVFVFIAVVLNLLISLGNSLFEWGHVGVIRIVSVLGFLLYGLFLELHKPLSVGKKQHASKRIHRTVLAAVLYLLLAVLVVVVGWLLVSGRVSISDALNAIGNRYRNG